MDELNEKVKKSNYKEGIKKLFSIPEIGILVPLILLIIIFTALNPIFLSPLNIANILRTMAFYGIIGCGLTLLMISGEIDLSVGSVAGLGAVITGLLLKHIGLNFILAMVIGILAGSIVGFINGILSVRFKIPSLITTLGMMYLVRGAVYVITNSKQIYPLGEAFKNFGQSLPLGVGWNFAIFLIILIVSDQLLRMTSFGRSLYAIGGNINAAKIAGINTEARKITAFVVCSSFAALSGILLSSRIAVVTPIIGQGWELRVIAGCVIGGISILGGIGTITGTLIGILIMGVLDTGMIMAGVNPNWQTVLVGFIMIAAVGFDIFKRTRMR